MTIANELPKSPFEAGIELHDTERQEGDRDLVAEVRDILVQTGCPEETVAATFDQNRFVAAAQGRIPIVQRTHLNRFLCLALMTSHQDTIMMRSELLPNGATDLWVKHINDVVAPFIAENKLLG